MSQLTTEDMSRVVVAGTRGQLKTAVEVAAGLAMIHINDFSGDEDGLALGVPGEESEEISRSLTKIADVERMYAKSPHRNLAQQHL